VSYILVSLSEVSSHKEEFESHLQAYTSQAAYIVLLGSLFTGGYTFRDRCETHLTGQSLGNGNLNGFFVSRMKINKKILVELLGAAGGYAVFTFLPFLMSLMRCSIRDNFEISHCNFYS
jgi:hypothetical protein